MLAVVSFATTVHGEEGTHRPPCASTEQLTPRGWCVALPSATPAPPATTEEKAPTNRIAAYHPAAKRAPTCATDEHVSSGHCCQAGAEWAPESGSCLVLHTHQAATIPLSLIARAAAAPSKQVTQPPGEWARVRAGTFTMGSPPGEPGHDDDEAQHQVTLTHDVLVQTTEVTQGQFEDVMGYDPSRYPACGRDCPVERVSWSEAASYANRLSDLADLPDCYSCSGSGPDVTCEPSGSPYQCTGYRLPTEAEWEYAARAGTKTALYTGNLTIQGEMSSPELDGIAWYGGNSGVSYADALDCSGWPGRQSTASFCGPHPVQQKQANGAGLYDMLGNVWEWCNDWYGPYGDAATDPTGPATGTARVTRGGGWVDLANFVRTARRDSKAPGSRDGHLGFRTVRSLP